MRTDPTEAPTSRSLAVQLEAFGPPAEVARVVEITVPPPLPTEVRVQMECAPVNPADLNVLEGKYGILPDLPAVAGIEGVGRVISAGCSTSEALLGKRVLLPHGFGAWRNFGNASASDLIVVPENIPVQQAAMVRINPATAFCLLHHFTRLQPGDWILQNAANSGVGRSVIQIARSCGLRTVNVVRRSGLAEDLKAIGADAVIEEGDGLARRITEACNDAPLRLALNAVGGECALSLAKALGHGGCHVTYGAMALQPLRIPNGLLIFKDLQFRGFWVSQWYRHASKSAVSSLFSQLFDWAASGVLNTPVEATYKLTEAREAVLHASRSARTGKVLLEN